MNRHCHGKTETKAASPEGTHDKEAHQRSSPLTLWSFQRPGEARDERDTSSYCRFGSGNAADFATFVVSGWRQEIV